MSPVPALLYLLQVVSPSFPTGAYAHSLGLETLVVDGGIADAADLQDMALTWLRWGVGPVEGTAIALARQAAAQQRFADVLALDQDLGALKPARESHAASTKTGSAFIRAAQSALPGPALLRYADDVAAGRAEGHAALAFALSCHDHEVPRRDALLAYLFAAVSNLVGVVARLIPLGQLDVQLIMARASEYVVDAAERAARSQRSSLGSATPWVDIASMRHERLPNRLCIS